MLEGQRVKEPSTQEAGEESPVTYKEKPGLALPGELVPLISFMPSTG